MSVITISKIFFGAVACATALQITIDTIVDGLVSETQYQQVADLRDDDAMAQFIQRFVASKGYTITSLSELSGLAPWYSGTRDVQSLAALQDDLAKKWWVVREVDQAEYEKVAAMRDDNAMGQFIQRLVAGKGYTITSLSELNGLAPWHSGTRADQNIFALQDELARSWWVISGPAFGEEEETSPFEPEPQTQASVDAAVPRQQALIAAERTVSAEKQSLHLQGKVENKAHASVYNFLAEPADSLFRSFPRQQAAEAQFDVNHATVKSATNHSSRAQEPHVPQAEFATNSKLVEDAANHSRLVQERPMSQAIFVSSPLNAPADYDTLHLKSLNAPVEHFGNDSRLDDDLVGLMELVSDHAQEHQETKADTKFNTALVEQVEIDQRAKPESSTTLMEQVDSDPMANSELNTSLVEQRAGSTSTMEVRNSTIGNSKRSHKKRAKASIRKKAQGVSHGRKRKLVDAKHHLEQIRNSTLGNSKRSNKKRAKASTGNKAQGVSHGTKRKRVDAKHPEKKNVRSKAVKPAHKKGTTTFQHKMDTSATAEDKKAAKGQKRGRNRQHHHVRAKSRARQHEQHVTR